MTTTDDAVREALDNQFTQREAGVVDLLDLYQHIEEIYVAATQASSQTPFAITSNSTNRE